MKNEIERWWDEASEYYQEETKIPTKEAHYGPFSPNENALKLLGNVNKKRVLELGCGGGQCSIAFAKKGALPTAIDISSKQLEFAKKLASENNVEVNFIKGNVENLKMLGDNYFDVVFSALTLMYIKDLKKCFLEVKRVLKKGGTFVFSLEHPFYLLMSPKNNKIEESYYDTGKKIQKETWPDGSKHRFIFYKRKVSDIINELLDSGFELGSVTEPFEIKKRGERIWEEGYSMRLVKLIAPTIIFKVHKK